VSDGVKEPRTWTVGELRAALVGVEDDLCVQVLAVSGACISEARGVISVEIDAARGPGGGVTPDEALLVLVAYSGCRAT
jgi:hypothetical protein